MNRQIVRHSVRLGTDPIHADCLAARGMSVEKNEDASFWKTAGMVLALDGKHHKFLLWTYCDTLS